MSAPWAGLAEEMVGVQKACANLGTPGALAEYVYNRCCAYEGLAGHQEVAEPLIATAIEHWTRRSAADHLGDRSDPPSIREPARGTVHHALLQHAHLYHNNAAFKLSVDTLIPLMIDALAMKAKRDWEKHERLVKEILESRGRPIIVPEGFFDDDFDLSTGQPK